MQSPPPTGRWKTAIHLFDHKLVITQKHVLSICVRQLVSYFADAAKSYYKLWDCGVVSPLIRYTNTVLELYISEALQLLFVFCCRTFACWKLPEASDNHFHQWATGTSLLAERKRKGVIHFYKPVMIEFWNVYCWSAMQKSTDKYATWSLQRDRMEHHSELLSQTDITLIKTTHLHCPQDASCCQC